MLTYSLSKAVSELKKRWLLVITPEEILGACQSQGMEWRNRLLNLVTTTKVVTVTNGIKLRV
jgi:hypothetical protein